MEKLFKLKANGTTVRTEILAGLTTFMTMAYIIALNPNLLTNFAVGTPLWNGVFLATCIASAIGTICMAFFANKPFVMAPGMGLNSFFAVVVANIAVINECEYESAFQAALVIILVEGIVFLILTLLKVREKIVEAIPLGVRYGIAPAIGLMLMNVGLGSNVGIYSENGGPFYMMRDFFGALTPSIIKGNMGAGYDAMVLTVVTAFLGVFVMVVLAKKGVKAAVLLGMLFSSVIYWAGSAIFLHVNPFASLATASFVPPFADMVSTTLFKFDFAGFVNIGWFTAITLVITFCMIDMFDTIGTLVGTASRAGMVDQDGNMPQMKEAPISSRVLRNCTFGINFPFYVTFSSKNSSTTKPPTPSWRGAGGAVLWLLDGVLVLDGGQLLAAQALDLQPAGDIVTGGVIADVDLVLPAGGQAGNIVLVAGAVGGVVNGGADDIAGGSLVVGQLPQGDLESLEVLVGGLSGGIAGDGQAVGTRHKVVGTAVLDAVKGYIQGVAVHLGHQLGGSGVHRFGEGHVAAASGVRQIVDLVLIAGFLAQTQGSGGFQDGAFQHFFGGTGRQRHTQADQRGQQGKGTGTFHILINLRGDTQNSK